jgi:hypothetical protein
VGILLTPNFLNSSCQSAAYADSFGSYEANRLFSLLTSAVTTIAGMQPTTPA